MGINKQNFKYILVNNVKNTSIAVLFPAAERYFCFGQGSVGLKYIYTEIYTVTKTLCRHVSKRFLAKSITRISDYSPSVRVFFSKNEMYVFIF